jgi:glycosyltransferase involved in cell wall biosynthesis
LRIAINAHLVAFNKTYRQAGVSKYTELLINNLAALAPDDEFIIYTGKQDLPATFAAASNFQLKVSQLPTIKPLVRIGWEQALAPFTLLRDRPTLLHCPVNVVPLAAPCATVLTIHDLGFMRFPERYKAAKRIYLRTLTMLSARRASHIITDAASIKSEVINLLGIKPERVTSIPLGVADYFKPETDAARLENFRQEKKLPKRFVLYLGTLEPRKNLPLLLQGFAQFRTQFGEAAQGIELVLGGAKGWLYEDIFRLVKELDLEQVTHFPGYINEAELPLWYNIAECFVYPSIYEGFGLPPLEAMACGVPVITSNTSTLPEVVGQAGLTVDPSSVSEMATALNAILSNPSYRQQLAVQSVEQARKFNWQTTAQQTLNVYREVVGNQKK